MAESESMDTYAARLASFSATLPGTKRRASNAKGSKAISWPHRNPSPEDLANAGFYYKPTPTSPDNTVCFMCERYLDGWEEDDDPLAEHLKHSSSCAWALVTSVGVDGVTDDPTSSRMTDARRETFASRWPHEGKRGWTCKTEKMVEAGWHFAPTPESDDFVTCGQCKLSLDGWEPKDNPFNEHYRRSADCRFFEFAGTTAPKGGRRKKGRASKASRVSTQSNLTVASEAPSIPDFEDSIDQTTMSQDTVISTASKSSKAAKGKKAGKGKGNKSNKAESSMIVDSSVLESADAAVVELVARPTKGKKRPSEQISDDDDSRGQRESTVRPEPPPKRRATRSKTSAAEEVQYPDLDASVIESSVPTFPQPPRGGRKRASSKARKVSTASTASKASLRAGVPDDSALDAELAAELEKALSDEEELHDDQMGNASATPPKATASTAPARRVKLAMEETSAGSEDHDKSTQDNTVASAKESESGLQRKTSKKAGRGKGKKIAELKAEKATITTDKEIAVAEPSVHTAEDETRPIDEDSGNEMDHSAALASKPNKAGKKKIGGRAKPAKKAQVEHDLKSITKGETDLIPQAHDLEAPEQSDHGPKSTARGMAKTKAPQQSMPGTFDSRIALVAPSEVQPSSPAMSPRGADQRIPVTITNALSPHRRSKEVTPSPSPQSSDAENQPPSSRPSASRPPLLPISPSKSQIVRVPLATPPKLSPSKINRPIEGLVSTYPWTATDVEMIFAATPGTMDKENILGDIEGSLPSPEQKMTVKEWVFHNAQKTESQLKDKCERIVGIFEKEGSRAMMALEGIECSE